MISRSTESNIDSHLCPVICCLRKSSVLFLCCDVDNARYLFRNGAYLLSVLRHLLSVFRLYYNKHIAVSFNILGLHSLPHLTSYSECCIAPINAHCTKNVGVLNCPFLYPVDCILIGFPDVLLFVNNGPQVCWVASNGNLKFADEMQNVILIAVIFIFIFIFISLIFPSIYIVNKPFQGAGLSTDNAES